MPRDIGTGLYHYPDGTPGNSGQTIFSARYNTFINDLTNTLNQALPVNMGGTGGTDVDSALVSLSAEKATQLVTNYDSHLWRPGSFRSDAAATGAPNSTSKFAGVCYIGEALANPPTNQNVVVEARDLDSAVKPGLLYTKQKTAGVWSAWNYTGTGDDQTAARSAIYAAPFDAMAYNGMQVNGSMEVSQEIGFAGTGTPSAYIADSWRSVYGSGMSIFAGAAGGIFSGFSSALLYTVSTAKASLAAPDVVSFQQNIEGYRIARLGWGAANPQPIVIAFWANHNRAGTYTVSIRNATGTRSYAATYTYTAGPEYKTLSIPGCVDGVWERGNLTGMLINFTWACGSDMTAPSANTWVNGNFIAAPGQVNNVASTSDVARITGVVVLPGTQAPTAAQSPLIMRPFDQELVTCQRYYQKLGSEFTGFAANTTQAYGNFVLRPNMRATPALALIAGSTANGINGPSGGPFTPTGIAGLSATSPKIVGMTLTSSGLTANHPIVGYGDNWMTADARL